MLDRMFNHAPAFHRRDKGLIGLIPGLILPLAVIPVFYFSQFSYKSFAAYLLMVKQPLILSPMLSLGLILNLFLFFAFITADYYNAARGVIYSTILYGIPIIFIKFFL